MNGIKIYEVINDESCEATLFFSKERAFLHLMSFVPDIKHKRDPHIEDTEYWIDKMNELESLGEGLESLEVDGVGAIFVDYIKE